MWCWPAISAHAFGAVAVGTRIWSFALLALSGLMMAVPPTVVELGGATRPRWCSADKRAEYKGGRDKPFGFFVGRVMKVMAGKGGNPALVNESLRRALS